jgi:hypothetical protein
MAGVVPPVAETAGKGLRQFSRQVWMKVMEKGRTTYMEVADELVEELKAEATAEARTKADAAAAASGEVVDPATFINPSTFDDRNVRRRCYDALNVLMALGIIAKNKKNITWCGLPPGYGTPELTAALRGPAIPGAAAAGAATAAAISAVAAATTSGSKRARAIEAAAAAGRGRHKAAQDLAVIQARRARGRACDSASRV